MRLEQLLQPLVVKQMVGKSQEEIINLEIDSRKVKKGDLFIALRGTQTDGHQYIEQAIKQGAAAILSEEHIKAPVPVVIVPDTRRAMAVIAAHFYQYPTKDLCLIGVTGTNGKTTTTHLIQKILQDDAKQTGIIGTIAMKLGDRTYPVKNTTPEITDLQASFRMMHDERCDYSVIEVSSHALDMGRTRGCEFHIGVFTNLTQDHLDYHGTMEEYMRAKGLLFSQLGNHYEPTSSNHAVAVLNQDDLASTYFAKITPAQVITYGIDAKADVQATNIAITPEGTSFVLHTYQGTTEIQMQMIGKFNVYNALAATAVALVEGVALTQIKESLQAIKGVAGRFETVQAGQTFATIIDYSHTPDSLENALVTIREFVQGKVITVVGCGGDRDRSKRPLMAQIAEKYSDLTILTSDNPRTEDPQTILEDMVAGLTNVDANRFQVLVERKDAIQYAIAQAQANDVILIAGKGHETYQEIHGQRIDFDDRLVAKDAILNQRGAVR